MINLAVKVVILRAVFPVEMVVVVVGVDEEALVVMEVVILVAVVLVELLHILQLLYSIYYKKYKSTIMPWIPFAYNILLSVKTDSMLSKNCSVRQILRACNFLLRRYAIHYLFAKADEDLQMYAPSYKSMALRNT